MVFPDQWGEQGGKDQQSDDAIVKTCTRTFPLIKGPTLDILENDRQAQDTNYEFGEVNGIARQCMLEVQEI